MTETVGNSEPPHSPGQRGFNDVPKAPRMHAELLPATGAWREGDDPGHRQFLPIGADRPFMLEGGGALRNARVAYETWGTLNADASNAILLCHALSGDSHAAGDLGPAHPAPGWWDHLVGPGRAFDTDRHFIVCANVIGGCQGSTGPASTNAETGKPYGSTFPVVSIRDMVRTQAAVATHLGIDKWLSVAGGSMGGMQVLEWAVMLPERVRSIIPIATTVAASAQQIAWGSVGRNAIRLDPTWNGGDYYDAPPGAGPHEGLAIARMISQITYRSDDVFNDRFGRQPVEPIEGYALWQRFQVERYLEYQGDKLARRFDTNSYLLITKAMDLHDIGRGRGGLAAALGRVTAPTLCMGIDSDTLYPVYQQKQIADGLQDVGTPVEYAEITSPHGHDAFLINTEQIAPPVTEFLAKIEADQIERDSS